MGPFTPPSQWRRDAVAMTTTHDLPTVAGWWRGRDIDWRTELGMNPAIATSNPNGLRATPTVSCFGLR